MKYEDVAIGKKATYNYGTGTCEVYVRRQYKDGWYHIQVPNGCWMDAPRKSITFNN